MEGATIATYLLSTFCATVQTWSFCSVKLYYRTTIVFFNKITH